MVRGKPLDPGVKQMIINQYKKLGKPYQQISANLGVARSTVHNVIKQDKDRLALLGKPKYGCPRATNPNDDLSLRRVVAMHPNASFVEIKNKWQNAINKPISMTTCRRRLQELGIEIPSRPPFQNYREPEVNIFAEEEKITPRQIEQQENNLDNNNIEDESSNPPDTTQSPQRKVKKTKNKKKQKTSSTLKATLNSLQTVTKAISVQHDEYMVFGEYIAMSLRTMPLMNALKCKEKLLSVIVNDRLNQGIEANP